MIEKIKEAEKKVSAILANLEIETGSIVRSVGVTDIDVSTMSDDRRQLARRVTIELERLPGTQWDLS